MLATLIGGQADGLTCEVPDWQAVYIAVLDGVAHRVPDWPDAAGKDLLNRAYGLWECYVRSADDAPGATRPFVWAWSIGARQTANR